MQIFLVKSALNPFEHPFSLTQESKTGLKYAIFGFILSQLEHLSLPKDFSLAIKDR